MKQAWVAVIIVTMVGLLLSRWGELPAMAPQSRVGLVVATSSSPMPGLVFLAHDRGFMADEGLDVTLQKQETGYAALQSLLENRADVATGADYPIVKLVLDGKKFALLAR